MSDNKRVLSFDPGIKNFGYAVLDVESIKTLEVGKIQNRVEDFKDSLILQVQSFSNEITDIIDKYSIDAIVAERFVPRGHLKGTSTENVSFMLGIIATMRPLTLILASQWKNWLNRKNKELLDTLYVTVKGQLETHEIDAILIGAYHARVDSKVIVNNILNRGTT